MYKEIIYHYSSLQLNRLEKEHVEQVIHSFPSFLSALCLCLQLNFYKENEKTYTYKTSCISYENRSSLSSLICILSCSFKCTVMLPTFEGVEEKMTGSGNVFVIKL